MNIDDIKLEMIGNGQDPDDYDITITNYGYKVEPKWFYEMKQVSKREDKPIIEDLNATAEFATITAMDKDEIAEMLVYALQKIDELEVRLNG